MEPGMEPSLWVVAGCLFEISLPTPAPVRWRWVNPTPEVTMMADEVRQGQHRFRFRAEPAGALAEVVELRFRCEEPCVAARRVAVQIAPEQLDNS